MYSSYPKHTTIEYYVASDGKHFKVADGKGPALQHEAQLELLIAAGALKTGTVKTKEFLGILMGIQDDQWADETVFLSHLRNYCEHRIHRAQLMQKPGTSDTGLGG